MKYKIIAIDLDGTLLDHTGLPTPQNIKAIQDAQDAGVLVLPCTGRAWAESKMQLRPIANLSQGVFLTGAMITNIQTDVHIDLAEIHPQLLKDLTDLLFDIPEALLIFKNARATGHDYLVTGNGKLTGNTQWWFDHCQSSAHHQKHLAPDDYHHAMRVSIVACQSRMNTLKDLILSHFGDQVLLHHFPAAATPQTQQSYHVLEIFASGIDKFRGINYIASSLNIPPSQIAAIGDQINDSPMIQGAGLGIAMQNATPAIKKIARRVTKSNNESGVAHAIYQMLDGKW